MIWQRMCGVYKDFVGCTKLSWGIQSLCGGIKIFCWVYKDFCVGYTKNVWGFTIQCCMHKATVQNARINISYNFINCKCVMTV